MSQWKLNNTANCDYTIEEVKEAQNDLIDLGDIPNFKKGYEVFKKALPQMFCEGGFWRTHGISPVSNLGCNCKAYIVKKIHCEGLGNDHFRATFIVEGKKIQIVEIYTKNRKEIENKKRICKYCKP